MHGEALLLNHLIPLLMLMPGANNPLNLNQLISLISTIMLNLDHRLQQVEVLGEMKPNNKLNLSLANPHFLIMKTSR
jgi:hypothetical protein